MPVGILRLNAKRSQPNPHIVFIKPLKGPDEEIARQFLERIAAQCVPIMRDNHLCVMTLEEYEPNREFVGRNFNAGEVVQLVLKAQGSRRWLPFPYVQMVMMHELAHCRQMNHSRAFWSVRDAYAAHMRRLWAEHYTGEGIWGRGAKLGTADGGPPLYERNMATPGDGDDGVLLEHLCGGTYQSRRGRKRKAKQPALTYREREDRRIRRKFGVNGVMLGDDLDERAKLDGAGSGSGSGSQQKQTTLTRGEVGVDSSKLAGPRVGASKTEQRRLAAKPRVAVSKRGRELRAAAALARFGQSAPTKKEDESEQDKARQAVDEIKREEEGVVDLSTDSDVDVDVDVDVDEYEDDPDQPVLVGPDAVDIDGTALLDGSGGSMVRVCEREDAEADGEARRELRELLQTASWKQQGKPSQVVAKEPGPFPAAAGSRAQPRGKPAQPGRQPRSKAPEQVTIKREEPGPDAPPPVTPSSLADASCPVCSFVNDPAAITCTMCSHVLDADAVPGAWHCQSTVCRARQGVRFLNAGDCGVCNMCGQRRR